jgi:hypothetical protein
VSEGAINVASVADVNDEDDEAILVDPVEDAVIPHPDAVKVFLALELLRSGRMRNLGQGEDRGVDEPRDDSGQCNQGAVGGPG